MDDADLVRQVLQGNLGAYYELVTRYTAQISALCRAMVCRRDVMENMVQETFLRGLDRLAGLREPARFGYWLTAIARNLCRDWLNERQYEHLPLRDVAIVFLPSLDGCENDRADRIARVSNCIQQLPERLREVIEIYYAGSRITYQELADLLGVSVATVNQLLTRARRWIRRCMENDDSNEESPSE